MEFNLIQLFRGLNRSGPGVGGERYWRRVEGTGRVVSYRVGSRVIPLGCTYSAPPVKPPFHSFSLLSLKHSWVIKIVLLVGGSNTVQRELKPLFLSSPINPTRKGNRIEMPCRDGPGVERERSEGVDPGGSQGRSWNFVFSPLSGDRPFLPLVGRDLAKPFD